MITIHILNECECIHDSWQFFYTSCLGIKSISLCGYGYMCILSGVSWFCIKPHIRYTETHNAVYIYIEPVRLEYSYNNKDLSILAPNISNYKSSLTFTFVYHCLDAKQYLIYQVYETSANLFTFQ